jgi:hypothetical protein
MNTSRIKIGLVAVAAAFMTLATSCKKEELSMEKAAIADPEPDRVTPASLAVRMSASPMRSVGMVNVEITGIAVQYVNGLDGPGPWTLLAIEPKVYNVLKYTDGVMAILADINNQIASGTMARVKLTFGYHNSVITGDGEGRQVHPLVISQKNRELIVNAKAELSKTAKAIVKLNFNTQQSISSEGNGTYILTPSVSYTGVEYIPVTNEQ